MSQGEWTKYEALRPGTVFETRSGVRAVKAQAGVVVLADGSMDHVDDAAHGFVNWAEEDVRPIPIAPMVYTTELEEDPVHRWFGLSRAQYLTVPRSLLESMPDPWQRVFVELLDQFDSTFDWRPNEGRYWVRLKDAAGHFVVDLLSDYRHPDFGFINRLRKTA